MYLEIIRRTFNIIYEKRYVLMKALLIPFISLMIVEYFLYPVIQDENVNSFDFYLLTAILFFITTIMSILVHRILLLDEEYTHTWGIYNYGKREMSFLFKAIGLVILVVITLVGIILILTFLGTLINSLIGETLSPIYPFFYVIIASIFVGILCSRVSLSFPAIAIDKPIDFSDSYVLTKEYKLLTLTLVVIIPFMLGSALDFVYGLVIEFLIGVFSPNFSVLYSILSVFITVITIGFLSITYAYIMDNQPIKVEKPINQPIFEELGISFKVTIDDRSSISFNEIKEQIKNQYTSKGYTRVVIDKEDNWMVKNIENEKSYIHVSHKNDEYKIETYNVDQKPIINLEVKTL